MSREKTKQTKWPSKDPAKTQISLGIPSVQLKLFPVGKEVAQTLSNLLSRTSEAHTDGSLPRLFWEHSWVPNKRKYIAEDIVFWIISGDYLFCIDKVCCLYSLYLPWWGNSNENTQHIFMSEKLKEISLLFCLS